MELGRQAAILAVELANDDSHGYDQKKRYGPDYDCSSLVITIYQLLGVNLSCTYTGNMKKDFLANGFSDVTGLVNLSSGSNMLPGDILLNEKHHTAIFVGNGRIVAARINEKGTVTGGKTGDQTGKEICVEAYYNYPWDCVLRPNAVMDEIIVVTPDIQGFPYVQKGSKGAEVAAVQAALWYKGFLVGRQQIDGDCGVITDGAIRAFQKVHRLEVDGVVGEYTATALFRME